MIKLLMLHPSGTRVDIILKYHRSVLLSFTKILDISLFLITVEAIIPNLSLNLKHLYYYILTNVTRYRVGKAVHFHTPNKIYRFMSIVKIHEYFCFLVEKNIITNYNKFYKIVVIFNTYQNIFMFYFFSV